MIRYTTDLTVGSPPQKITLLIDTGSSDIWVNEASASYCANPDAQPGCNKYGTYHSESSTSRVPVADSYFSVDYDDDTGASGGFVKDTITVGGQELTGFQFGEAYSSGSPLGVLGLGYEANEHQPDSSTMYPTLPEALVSRGLINLNAYSIWLNDIATAGGTIWYGGVDKAKYWPPLTTLDIEKGPNIPYLGVSVNSIAFKEAKALVPFAPLVDTGTEYTYLPNEILDIIFTPLGVVYNADGDAFVDCSRATSTDTVDFELGSGVTFITIRVPLSSMVYASRRAETPKNAQGADLCTIAITKLDNSADPGTLGDSFLRSAYVVMDLTHNQISIAQSIDTAVSNVVEIPADGIAAINT